MRSTAVIFSKNHWFCELYELPLDARLALSCCVSLGLNSAGQSPMPIGEETSCLKTAIGDGGIYEICQNDLFNCNPERLSNSNFFRL